MKALWLLLCAFATVVQGRYRRTVQAKPSLQLPEHSFSAPFLLAGWRKGIPNWRLEGDALLLDDSVRLTPDLKDRWGIVANTVPNSLKGWRAEVQVRIHARRNVGADGMAIWYTAEPASRPKTGSGVSTPVSDTLWGMRTDFKGFGLVLDTYDNDAKREGSTIAAVVNDGKRKDWDKGADLAKSASFHCFLEYRNLPRDEWVTLVLEHVPGLQVVDVNVRLPGSTTPTFCGRAKGIKLPPGFFWSLTGVTGSASDNHDVRSFALFTEQGQGDLLGDGGAWDVEKDRKEREAAKSGADGGQ